MSCPRLRVSRSAESAGQSRLLASASWPGSHARLIALAVLVLATAGCGRGPQHRPSSSQQPDSVNASTESVNPAEAPHPSPPQPTGPQVGGTDPILNDASPKLAEWSAMWSQSLPNFSPDSLWRVGRDRWRPTDVRSFEPMKPGPDVDPGDYLASELLGIGSPDASRCLDSSS